MYESITRWLGKKKSKKSITHNTVTLRSAPVVSYRNNQFALYVLFKWVFRVNQSEMLSLNTGVTTSFFFVLGGAAALDGVDLFNPVTGEKYTLISERKVLRYLGRELQHTITVVTRSAAPGDVQLNIQSGGHNFQSAARRNAFQSGWEMSDIKLCQWWWVTPPRRR